MVMRNYKKPPIYLLVLSFGITGFLLCMGWGAIKAQHYKVEYQQFRLEVGTALSKVKAVSDTLEHSAETSAIAPEDKQEIQELTEQTTAVLEQVEADIEQQSDDLIFLEE